MGFSDYSGSGRVTSLNSCTGHYFKQLGNLPILTKEQETEYGKILHQTRSQYFAIIASVPGIDGHIRTLRDILLPGRNGSAERVLERIANAETYQDRHTAVTDLLSRSHFSQLGHLERSVSEEHPQLSDCLESCVTSGKEAARALVEGNLRLVLSIAKRYKHRGVAYEDLVQEGNMGLIRAAEFYDYTLGCRFGTFAVWCIRQEITRALDNQKKTVRPPANRSQDNRTLYNAAQYLIARHGRCPSKEELMQATGLSMKDMDYANSAAMHEFSMDAVVDDSRTLHDILHKPADAPEEAVSRTQQRQQIISMIGSARNSNLLTPEEYSVIDHMVGISGEEHDSRETAEELGIPLVTVRKHMFTACRKLYRDATLRAGLLDLV